MKIPKILFKNKVPQSGVYCIENTKNGKIYIGSSKNIYQRLHVHRVYLNNKTHQNIKLQNSWSKHSEDNFICYSLEHCEHNNLTIREQYWIDTLKPWYNITLNVIRNTLSEESRKKISETLKKGYKDGTIKLTRIRPVKVFDINGNYIQTFSLIKECAEYLNICHTSIQRVLKGKYKQCKGYQFQYLEDDIIMKKIEVQSTGRAKMNKKPVPVKQEELLENPITVCEDNQQPSLTSNSFEGSTTNSQIQPSNVEDSNADTSILHQKTWMEYEEWKCLQSFMNGDDIV